MGQIAPERQVARTVIAWLKLVLPTGSIVASVETEQRGAGATAIQRARYGAARKASGVVSGFPDAAALLPGGRVIWMEWKRADGGVLSLSQQGMHARLASLGHAVIVATSIETARHGLQGLGIALHEDGAQLTALPRVRREKLRGQALAAPAVDLP